MCQNKSILFFYTILLPFIPVLFTRLPCIITSQIVTNQSTFIYIKYIYIVLRCVLYMPQFCFFSLFNFHFFPHLTFSGIMYRTGHVVVYNVQVIVLVKLQMDFSSRSNASVCYVRGSTCYWCAQQISSWLILSHKIVLILLQKLTCS